MKIKIETYSLEWAQDFEKIKAELRELIGFLNPKIEHIGSTSVEDLSAKPIIDILVGVNYEKDLDKVIMPLVNNNYVYYEKYNKDMPYRRFFIKHKINPQDLSIPQTITDKDIIHATTTEHDLRLAHIHVLVYNSEHWIRHIAFRDYLRTHTEVKNQYQQLKENLSLKEWVDGNEYNEAKDSFIKTEEKNAIKWYSEKQQSFPNIK